MDYKIEAPNSLVKELSEIFEYYEHKYDIVQSHKTKIIRTNGDITKEYDTVEDFLLNEIFYKKKKNLIHNKIPNIKDAVVNFEISPLQIITNNEITVKLLSNKLFNKYLTKVNNYGTFIRFAENKVQRLYWNPAVNSGIPLTPKGKDPVYELLFFLHDCGHFLLPDLIFTGKLIDTMAKNIYVSYRLLGESITIVLNEMLAVNYLKDFDEFKQKLKLPFDKPFKLFQILKHIDFKNKHHIKQLFWASYLYFCKQDITGFQSLIDTSKANHEEIWNEFHKRYLPVSQRGREWTETNFEQIKKSDSDYKRWWKHAEQFSDELQFETIEKYYNVIQSDDNDIIMEKLFEKIWTTVIEPLFFDLKDIQVINEDVRQIIAYKRYLIGNIFLLIKYNVNIDEIIKKLIEIKVENISKVQNLYLLMVKDLYDKKIISMNEYHNFKNIYVLMPPNMLKKNDY